MGDFGKRQTGPFTELSDELVELVRPFAEDLGCINEVEHARTIVRRASSELQLNVYNEALDAGASERDAQIAVVDWLVDEKVRFKR